MSNAGILTPRIVEAPDRCIAGLAGRHDGTSGAQARTIGAQWQAFAPHLGRVPGQTGATAYGVVFDAADMMDFGYLAGVEVTTDAPPEGFDHVTLPGGRYAVFTHEGPMTALPRTMQAIFGGWLPDSGETPAREGVSVFERYEEGFDLATGEGGIEIWLRLQD